MEMKDVYDIFLYVTQTLGQPAVVIDSDDLLSNPGWHTVDNAEVSNVMKDLAYIYIHSAG